MSSVNQYQQSTNRCLQSDLDLSEVFASPHLQGLHHLRPISQTRDYTCGAASVATACRYLGLNANEGQCAQALKTTRVAGTTPENMIRYFRSRELNCRAYENYPFEVLVGRCRKGQVTLVDWNDYGGHWVIVAGIEPIMRAIVLADPARPKSCFAAHSFSRFQRHWHATNYVRGGHYHQLAVLVDPWSSGSNASRGEDIYIGDYARLRKYRKER